MKRKILAIIMCVLIVTVSGCGASKKNDSSLEFTTDSKNNMDNSSSESGSSGTVGYENYKDTEQSVHEVGSNSTVSQTTAENSSRKLIKTVDLTIETLEFDEFIKLLENKTSESGGYIESSSSENSSYRYDRLKNATYTIRVPYEKLDQFVTMIGENANVIGKTSKTEDATLSYYDTESRKKALEIQQERLLELLKKAEKIEDIIELEARLSDVTYELESQSSILRNYDNLVRYSTIRVSVYEVERETKVEKESTWQKMKHGLSDTMYEIKEGIEAFAIFVVSNLPYIIFWGIILVIAVLVIKRRLRIKNGIANTRKEPIPPTEDKDNP